MQVTVDSQAAAVYKPFRFVYVHDKPTVVDVTQFSNSVINQRFFQRCTNSTQRHCLRVCKGGLNALPSGDLA